MKVEWLDRSFFKGPYLAIVTSQKQFDSALKRLKVQDDSDFCLPGADGTTHNYYKDGQLCVIVGIRSTSKRKVDVYGLLIHEAVHVWQSARAQIVKTIDASRLGGLEAEMEAYAIQNIAQNLIESYRKQVKK